MKNLILLTGLTIFGLGTCAQAQLVASDRRPGSEYERRNLALEKGALAQRAKIDAMLSPSTKRKLNSIFSAFLSRLLRDKKSIGVSKIANEELARQFRDLSPQQSNILTFYIFAGVIKLLPPHANRSATKSQKDSIGEMNEKDMLWLQHMMEKKSELETMISNIMKAGFEGGQAAIQALKAS